MNQDGIPFGPTANRAEQSLMDQWRKRSRSPHPKTRELGNADLERAVSIKLAREAMESISSYMCKGSSVEIIGCNLGGYKDGKESESGQELHQYLIDMFNNSTVAPLIQGDVMPTRFGPKIVD